MKLVIFTYTQRKSVLHRERIFWTYSYYQDLLNSEIIKLFSVLQSEIRPDGLLDVLKPILQYYKQNAHNRIDIIDSLTQSNLK